MKKKNKLIIGILIGLGIGLMIGMIFAASTINNQMKNYDLFNCVYNNAYMNEFNQNPSMIEKIQNECICFRENNYTNLLEVNCSR